MFASHLLKTTIVTFLVDSIWLFTVGIYIRNMIERIQGQPFSPRYIMIIFVYPLLAYMILQTKTYTEAAIYGACIYGIYEWTNYAMFEQYDWRIALVDTFWGGFLFVAVRYLMEL
jgi:uncharacterized membrane protein